MVTLKTNIIVSLEKSFDFYRMKGLQEKLFYDGKVKSYSLAYNRHETRDKWPLGRDPDRSWCRHYTTVKLSW